MGENSKSKIKEKTLQVIPQKLKKKKKQGSIVYNVTLGQQDEE